MYKDDYFFYFSSIFVHYHVGVYNKTRNSNKYVKNIELINFNTTIELYMSKLVGSGTQTQEKK